MGRGRWQEPRRRWDRPDGPGPAPAPRPAPPAPLREGQRTRVEGASVVARAGSEREAARWRAGRRRRAGGGGEGRRGGGRGGEEEQGEEEKEEGRRAAAPALGDGNAGPLLPAARSPSVRRPPAPTGARLPPAPWLLRTTFCAQVKWPRAAHAQLEVPRRAVGAEPPATLLWGPGPGSVRRRQGTVARASPSTAQPPSLTCAPTRLPLPTSPALLFWTQAARLGQVPPTSLGEGGLLFTSGLSFSSPHRPSNFSSSLLISSIKWVCCKYGPWSYFINSHHKAKKLFHPWNPTCRAFTPLVPSLY